MPFISLLFLIFVIFDYVRVENVKLSTKVLFVTFFAMLIMAKIALYVSDVISKNDWTGLITELWSGTIALLILLVSPTFYRWLTTKPQPRLKSTATLSAELSPATTKSKKKRGVLFVLLISSIPFWIFQFMSGMFYYDTLSSAATLAVTRAMGIILISVLFGWFFFRGTPRQYLVPAAAITFAWFVGICFSGITADYSLYVKKIIVAAVLALLVGSALVWFIRRPSIGSVVFLLVVHVLHLGISIFAILLLASGLKFVLLMPAFVMDLLLFIGISALIITGYVNYKKAVQSGAPSFSARTSA